MLDCKVVILNIDLEICLTVVYGIWVSTRDIDIGHC